MPCVYYSVHAAAAAPAPAVAAAAAASHEDARRPAASQLCAAAEQLPGQTREEDAQDRRPHDGR